MGSGCSSKGNAGDGPPQEAPEAVGNMLASPMPGQMMPGQVGTQPLNAPANNGQPMPHIPPRDNGSILPRDNGSVMTGRAMPDNASPFMSGIDNPDVLPANFFEERICMGANCPKATHVEISEGVYQNIATGEIIYANGHAEVLDAAGAPARMSGNEMVQRMSGSVQPISHVVQQVERVSYAGSQALGNNNIIVAAAMRAEEPPLAPEPEAAAAEEDEHPTREDEAKPEKEKKQRRSRWRRKKRN